MLIFIDLLAYSFIKPSWIPISFIVITTIVFLLVVNFFRCPRRHFKGDRYLVEDFATDSESGLPVVVYRKLYDDGSLWVRPLGMFAGEVDRAKYPDARQRYRFELEDVPSVNHR